MARRRSARRTRTRTVVRTVRRGGGGFRRAVRRRSGRMNWMRVLKAAGIGVGLSVGSGFVAGRAGAQAPLVRELGQRGGAIAASKFGGTAGQMAFQVADALLDRYLARGTGINIGGSRVTSGTLGYI